METEVAAVAACIAFAALVVSVVVAVKQTRIAREQTAIQERLAAVEEARRAEEVEARAQAQVTASIVRDGPRTQLVLRNEGPALARGLNASVGSVDGHQPVPPVNGLHILPVDLHPGQPLMFGIPIAMGDAAMMRVTVRWADEAGSHEESFALQTF